MNIDGAKWDEVKPDWHSAELRDAVDGFLSVMVLAELIDQLMEDPEFTDVLADLSPAERDAIRAMVPLMNAVAEMAKQRLVQHPKVQAILDRLVED